MAEWEVSARASSLLCSLSSLHDKALFLFAVVTHKLPFNLIKISLVKEKKNQEDKILARSMYYIFFPLTWTSKLQIRLNFLR